MSALEVAKGLGISRNTVYYAARPPSTTEKRIVARIPHHRRKHPAAGRRKMVALLAADGLPISPGRAARIMRKYNLGSIRVTGDCTRRSRRAGRVPNLPVSRVPQAPNQFWADDLTLVPVDERGFMYVCVVCDLESRMLLATGLSNTGDSALCCISLKRAIRRYGTPQVLHSDQGTTYNSSSHLGLLAKHRILPSMTEAGFQDNPKTERLIGTLKNEYLRQFSYETGAEIKTVMDVATRLYNTERPHATLGHRKPAQVYYGMEKIKRGDLLDPTIADFSSELGDSLDLP